MMQKDQLIEASYGYWESYFDIESVFQSGFAPSYPFEVGEQLYWLEPQSHEKGRMALMTQHESQSNMCISLGQFNIRTRVHEYGGKCFCVIGDEVIFNNYEDGCLYRQSLITHSVEVIQSSIGISGCIGFADLVVTMDAEWVIGVIELDAGDVGSEENVNQIVAISLSRHEPRENSFMVLAEGQDFYCNPSLSPDGKQIAWLEWSHPFMPWDQTRLVVADLKSSQKEISVCQKKSVIDEPERSVCQIGFSASNELIFVSDSEDCDFWSFYKFDGMGINRLIDLDTNIDGEYGEPHWVFGQSRWQQSEQGLLYAVRSTHHGDEINEINPVSGECRTVSRQYAGCRQLFASKTGKILFVGLYPDRQPQILNLNINSKTVEICQPGPDSLSPEYVSEPVPICFENNKHASIYGYFYPPNNPKYLSPDNSLPPLMVVIHGGPTSRATPEYSLIKQYFCSVGYALLDLNHRGSSGYGRRYRQQLRGQWGEIDADDIADGIKFVVENEWVDRRNLFIRGSSAGGYAVLRALTRYPDIFAGGACYYGIGNLITLSEITHKFESKYTDNLIGEAFDPVSARKHDSKYISRSPIFQIDALVSPLIIFQGREDKVVPPEVAREIVSSLEDKGVEYAYTEYPEEGHGFRYTQSRIDALQKETAFFAKIINSR